MQDGAEQFYSSTTILHVGDYIALRLTAAGEKWLSCEGLLNDDCFISTDSNQFDNCIWEIHVQNQYSATREYKESLAAYRSSSAAIGNGNNNANNAVSGAEHHIIHKGINRVITKEQLSQLRRAALNEQRLNEKLMNIKIGKPVAFGDAIQLRHVKSRKFLTVSANALAKDERENMKITVETDGDSLSCLGFIPKQRFEREGQLLINQSEVMLRVNDRPGEFLHAAKNYITEVSGDTPKAEVNCSLEASLWTVVLYQIFVRKLYQLDN
jgi:hypothetical protein